MLVGAVVAVLLVWLVGAAVTTYDLGQMAFLAPIAVLVVGCDRRRRPPLGEDRAAGRSRPPLLTSDSARTFDRDAGGTLGDRAGRLAGRPRAARGARRQRRGCDRAGAPRARRSGHRAVVPRRCDAGSRPAPARGHGRRGRGDPLGDRPRRDDLRARRLRRRRDLRDRSRGADAAGARRRRDLAPPEPVRGGVRPRDRHRGAPRGRGRRADPHGRLRDHRRRRGGARAGARRRRRRHGPPPRG